MSNHAPSTHAEDIERIGRLQEHLTSAVGEKSLLANDWSHVVVHLEQLYAAAMAAPRLVSPWPQLCAYRLAHILMRDAKSTAELTRVLALLDEPCRLEAFGPRPHLLRVAVLHRLRLLEPQSSHDAAIKASFEAALRLAARPQEQTEALDAARATQRVTANLIEQTAYMLGLPFVGKIDTDIASYGLPQGCWAVLIRGLPVIWMPEALARLFYLESAARIQPALLFECVEKYPAVRMCGEKLSSKNASFAASIAMSEHDPDVLWRVLKLGQGVSVGSSLKERNRIEKNLSLFKEKTANLASSRLNGAEPVTGTLNAVNFRFADTIDYVGLVRKNAVPDVW